MWFVALVVAAAQLSIAYMYLEYMYGNGYYCQLIPYENGDVSVTCWYLP